jgi:dTDP-glucose 4,6-dehydratase
LKSAKFLQVSTDEVYGSIESGSWNEDCALQPNSPYAATKASADLLVRSYVKTFNLNAVVTRSCNNFGPFQHVEKFMPTMITHLINGDLVPIYGNGMNTREWVFVGDNIQGIHKALVYGNEGSVYNLGSGHEYTNIDLFKEVCRVGGFDESLFKFVQDRKGHDYRYSVDFEKASQELNYSPSSEMASQLKATIEWYYERKL